MKVIIVGAGIGGLVAGYRLKKSPDTEVAIFERADRCEGQVGTLEIGEVSIVDHSAQFPADKYERTFQFWKELDIWE